ncbi:MAG: amidophosphoribosyltransferase [Bacteroidales bacterium]|nr:amidophosphoribosyltransferase [Candidatus Cryptobacteroides faecihippi]
MEPLKHECGVAMIRLLKPVSYFEKKYGTRMYGLNKLYLLMEKQHNRGQEGAGLACIKMDAAPGEEYMFRERALGSGAITEIFSKIQDKEDYAGQLYMGHLRYSTTGKSGISYVHPFLRRNNWKAKNLCLCGNFNLTNTDEIFKELTSKGQHPRIYSDTYMMLELLGHRLDRESERVFRIAEEKGLQDQEITEYIESNIDICNVLRTSMPGLDGGYVMCGITGSGEMFTVRDPWGIRPCFWYKDDEVLVVASERPVIQTTFDHETDQVNELRPGEAITADRNGKVKLTQIIEPKEYKACSFERIYFSRGSDRDIYRERKALGEQLTPDIVEAIDDDIEHTVFSFIPNTAEVAFYGMLDGFKKKDNEEKAEKLFQLMQDHKPSKEEISGILHNFIRNEKVAIKDIKLRTFIAEGNSKKDLAAHVYDITYGSLEPGVDNLVIIDDSIVRGTTLKESILRILDRLHPKKIVLVSSCPQVRFPDYYGIDMAHMDEFIAFKAAIELLKDRGMGKVIGDVYRKCLEQRKKPLEEMVNPVKEIYSGFTAKEISAKMVEMLRPEGVKTPIEIVYQSIEGLHNACPNSPGDWYFTGDYPTPGGTRQVNEAFIDYYERTQE